MNESEESDHLDWHVFISHTPETSEDFYQYNIHLSNALGLIRKLPVTRHHRYGKERQTL